MDPPLSTLRSHGRISPLLRQSRHERGATACVSALLEQCETRGVQYTRLFQISLSKSNLA